MTGIRLHRADTDRFLNTVFAHVPTISALDRLRIFLELLRNMSDDEKIAVVHAMDSEDLKLISSYSDSWLTQLTERF